MAREFGCPDCGAKVSVHFSGTGDVVVCRACGASIPVPAIGEELPITAGSAPAPGPLPRPSGGVSGTGIFSDEPLSVGLVLGETFRIFSTEFPRVLAIAAIGLPAILGFQLLAPWFGQPGSGSSNLSRYVVLIVSILALIVLSQASTAALTYGTFQYLRGERMDLVQSLKVGFRRVPRLVLTSLAMALLALLGALLCIVPGVIIFLRLAVSIPVTVVEGASAGDALGRSRELTKGHTGQIFGIFAVAWVLSFVANVVVALLPFPYGVIGQSAISVVGTGLSAIMSVVLYYALRSRKESIGVDEIAAVFE